MLIIDRKDAETIDRMVKRYKRKHRSTKLGRELRDRKYHLKDSVSRRLEKLNAEYRRKKFGSD